MRNDIYICYRYNILLQLKTPYTNYGCAEETATYLSLDPRTSITVANI